jgi:hypothetical protein
MPLRWPAGIVSRESKVPATKQQPVGQEKMSQWLPYLSLAGAFSVPRRLLATCSVSSAPQSTNSHQSRSLRLGSTWLLLFVFLVRFVNLTRIDSLHAACGVVGAARDGATSSLTMGPSGASSLPFMFDLNTGQNTCAYQGSPS